MDYINKAILGGIAEFHGIPVTVIAQEKENISRNFGMPSPEGFASILWKDSKRAKEAAEVMKLTAFDLKKVGIIEKIISEPLHFSTETLPSVCSRLDNEILEFIKHYHSLSTEELLSKRYFRFRNM